tara:strand:+ start:284 stop:565 length:282 start_codon:yes stop_codon:yes gene_type:complete
MAIGQLIFSKTLTGAATLDIASADGVTQVSVLCTTATAGSILGTGTVDGTSSDAVSIAENTSLTLGTSSGFPLDGVTITAPASCTLLITGSIG